MTDQTTDTNHYAAIKAIFGVDEYPFRVGWHEAAEWEEKRARSLMLTFQQSLGARSMMLEDVREIVRLGLVGGGMVPAEAVRLVKRYVEQRPIGENVELALTIMDAALFGSAEYQARKKTP